MQLSVCLLALLFAFPALSQAPASSTQPVEKRTKALIQGKAVNAATQEPIKRATLMLIHQAAPGTPVRVESDENGVFEFPDVAPGKYQLLIDKQGFARQFFGSRGNPLSGSTIEVAAGQEVKGLLFSAVTNTIVAGKVTDDQGEPLANVQVLGLRGMFRRGKRDYLPNTAAQTNDLGEYRLTALGPGKYLVVALNRQLNASMLGLSGKPADGKPVRGPVNTYYPNATDVASAATVDTTTGGAEVRGIDIRMAKLPVVSVKGKVAGISFPLSKQLIAWLMPKGSGVLGMATRNFALIQTNDGAFEFRNVPPGSYVISATAADGSSDASGALAVNIVEKPVEGLQLMLTPGAEIAGALVSDPAVSFKGAQVILEPQDFVAIMPPRSAVSEDGSFALKNVPPDRFFVQVQGAPPELYVKSIRYGSEDVLESGFDGATGAAGRLEIQFAADGAAIDGMVTGDDDKPLSGVTVALIPDNGMRSRYRTINTDQKGTFSIKGVAPGSYKLYAWEVLEMGSHEDPEFVKQYTSRAEKVDAKKEGRLSFTLKVIPAPKESR